MSDELLTALDSAIKREKARRKMEQHTTDVQEDCRCPSCVHYQSINDGVHDPSTCPWREAHR